MSRILLLRPSSLELLRPSSMAARMRWRLPRTVLDKVTKAGMRLRHAQASHQSRWSLSLSGIGQSIEVAEAFLELPTAVEHRPAAAQFVKHRELGRLEG